MEEVKPVKPVKAKPHFYACLLLPMQELAKELGYNLIAHGSFNRDFDLVAIPWVDNPEPESKLVQSLDEFIRGYHYEDASVKLGYNFSVLPGGRHSYVININRGGKYNGYTDEQYYLDISFTPLVVSN